MTIPRKPVDMAALYVVMTEAGFKVARHKYVDEQEPSGPVVWVDAVHPGLPYSQVAANDYSRFWVQLEDGWCPSVSKPSSVAEIVELVKRLPAEREKRRAQEQKNEEYRRGLRERGEALGDVLAPPAPDVPRPVQAPVGWTNPPDRPPPRPEAPARPEPPSAGAVFYLPPGVQVRLLAQGLLVLTSDMELVPGLAEFVQASGISVVVERATADRGPA